MEFNPPHQIEMLWKCSKPKLACLVYLSRQKILLECDVMHRISTAFQKTVAAVELKILKAPLKAEKNRGVCPTIIRQKCAFLHIKCTIILRNWKASLASHHKILKKSQEAEKWNSCHQENVDFGRKTHWWISQVKEKHGQTFECDTANRLGRRSEKGN